MEKYISLFNKDVDMNLIFKMYNKMIYTNNEKNVCVNEGTIKRNINLIAKQIVYDSIYIVYDHRRNFRDIVLLGLYKNSIMFMPDLAREIERVSDLNIEIELIKDIKDINASLIEFIKNKCVIILDTVINSGNKILNLKKFLLKYRPVSVKTCALLYKNKDIIDNIDYKGINIPDVFVVGYGIGNPEKYRILPYIEILD